MSAGNKASSQQDIASNCEVTQEYSEHQIDESPILILTQELSAFEPEISQSENLNEIHPVYLQEEQEMSLSQVLAHYDPPVVTILEDLKQEPSQNIKINKTDHVVAGEETGCDPLQSHHEEDAIAGDSAAQGDDNKSDTDAPFICIRRGCTNPAIVSIEWEDEYCSNECAVSHCKDSFTQWLASLK